MKREYILTCIRYQCKPNTPRTIYIDTSLSEDIYLATSQAARCFSTFPYVVIAPKRPEKGELRGSSETSAISYLWTLCPEIHTSHTTNFPYVIVKFSVVDAFVHLFISSVRATGFVCTISHTPAPRVLGKSRQTLLHLFRKWLRLADPCIQSESWAPYLIPILIELDFFQVETMHAKSRRADSATN